MKGVAGILLIIACFLQPVCDQPDDRPGDAAARRDTFVMSGEASDAGSGQPESLQPPVLVSPDTLEQALPARTDIKAMLDAAVQDEYRALTTLQRMIEDFGDVRPFSNIVQAEGWHMQALARLYRRYGWKLPANEWKKEDVPAYASVQRACEAGALAERENAALYERFLALDLPADVRLVFENLQQASLEKHLPAFERCAQGRSGGGQGGQGRQGRGRGRPSNRR